MNVAIIAVTIFYVFNFPIVYTCSLVFWNRTTDPAVFGKDVVLTCTVLQLRKLKDCAQHTWSGGTGGRGLMNNGFSSNEEKYEEKANLSTSQFSLIIRDFGIKDVNVNYTCSCGFNTCTKMLQLDSTHFQYSTDEAHALITTYNNTLKIQMQMIKVYPLPICAVYIGNREVSNKVRLTYRKSGLFYSVHFVAEYKLGDEDCNQQPIVQCDLLEQQIIFEGNNTHGCSVAWKLIKGIMRNTCQSSGNPETTRMHNKHEYNRCKVQEK